MAVTFLPIQQGSGDPSPTNVRPIIAPLNITGIGEIWGGSFDVRTGVITENRAKKLFDGNLSSDDIGITVAEYVTQISWVPYISIGTLNGTFMSDTLKYSGGGQPYLIWRSSAAPRMFMGLPTDVTTIAKAIEWFANNPTTVIYYLATPITHTLTPSQYAEACEQLHVPKPNTELMSRRHNLETPHIATATGAVASFSTDIAAPL